MLLIALAVLSERNSRVRGHFRVQRLRSDHSPAALSLCAKAALSGHAELPNAPKYGARERSRWVAASPAAFPNCSMRGASRWDGAS